MNSGRGRLVVSVSTEVCIFLGQPLVAKELLGAVWGSLYCFTGKSGRELEDSSSSAGGNPKSSSASARGGDSGSAGSAVSAGKIFRWLLHTHVVV